MRKIIAILFAGAMICAAYPAYADEDRHPQKDMGASELRTLFSSGGYLKLSRDEALGPLSVPPPASGSAKEALDFALAADAASALGSARWDQAVEDAALYPDKILAGFFNVAGVDFSAEKLPNLEKLIRLAMADFALSTTPTKQAYSRPRPFMVNGRESCTPDWEIMLRQDGSYPSGHSALGWGMALVLSEVMPDKSAQMLKRGQEFGESRLVCNVHWHSDILLGQTLATNIFFRLKGNVDFQADLHAAKLEMAKYRE